VAVVICIVITFVLMMMYIQNRNWMISNILCISMVVYFAKFIKITSLCGATIATGIFVLVALGARILVAKYQAQNDVSFGIELPFMIQVPFMQYLTYPDCAKLDYDSLFFPAALISFGFRFDLGHGLNVYHRTSLVGFVIGSVIAELFMVQFHEIDAQFFFTLPCIVVAFVCVGAIRGELKHLWKGVLTSDDEENLRLRQPQETNNKALELGTFPKIGAPNEEISLTDRENGHD